MSVRWRCWSSFPRETIQHIIAVSSNSHSLAVSLRPPALAGRANEGGAELFVSGYVESGHGVLWPQ